MRWLHLVVCRLGWHQWARIQFTGEDICVYCERIKRRR